MSRQALIVHLEGKVEEVEKIRKNYVDIPSATRIEKYWEGYRDALKNLADELRELPTK